MAKRKETECAVGNRQDEEEILKTYQTEDYDYLANSATGMDCTGLMYRTPSNENEMESYQEVYQYLPPNVRVDAMDGKDSHKQQGGQICPLCLYQMKCNACKALKKSIE